MAYGHFGPGILYRKIGRVEQAHAVPKRRWRRWKGDACEKRHLPSTCYRSPKTVTLVCSTYPRRIADSPEDLRRRIGFPQPMKHWKCGDAVHPAW